MPLTLCRLMVRTASVLFAFLSLAVGIAVADQGDEPLAPDKPQATLAYAAETETLFRSNGETLYSSQDGGRNWVEIVLPPAEREGRIATIAVSQSAPVAVYVAGLGTGIIKSLDGGKSWTRISRGLPKGEVVALAVHSTEADTLFAVIAEEGIYRSEDGGAQWRLVDKGPPAKISQLVHSNMEGSMQSGWIFAATDEGVFRSMDCFCGFRPAGEMSDVVSAVTYNPKQPKTIYASVGQQVLRSSDGGEQWTSAGSPGGAIAALVHSPSGVLYALRTDSRVASSADEGRTWK